MLLRGLIEQALTAALTGPMSRSGEAFFQALKAAAGPRRPGEPPLMSDAEVAELEREFEALMVQRKGEGAAARAAMAEVVASFVEKLSAARAARPRE